MRRKLVRAVMLLLAVTSCQSGMNRTSAPRDATARDAPLASPFERAIFGDPTDWAAKVEASATSTARCMHELGWPAFRPAESETILGLPETRQEREEVRRTNGYGIVRRPTEASTSPNEDFFDTLTEAETAAVDKALWERPDAARPGCMYVGHLAAFGNLLFLDDGYRELAQMVGQRIASDPDMTAADAQWADCMAGRGYDYGRPEDATGDISTQISELTRGVRQSDWDSIDGMTELAAEEMEVAAADLDCDDQVRLSEQYVEVRDRIQAEYLGDAVFDSVRD